MFTELVCYIAGFFLVIILRLTRLAHYFVVSLVRSRAVGLTTAWSRASLTPRTASKRVSPTFIILQHGFLRHSRKTSRVGERNRLTAA